MALEGLLGAPMLLFELKRLDHLDDESPEDVAVMGSCLFYAIDWFRETLNAFARCRQHKIMWKLCRRLHHIVVFEDHLLNVLKNQPSFHPIGIPGAESATVRAKAGKGDPDVLMANLRRKYRFLEVTHRAPLRYTDSASNRT